jgi:hypothetical protein
LPEDAFGSASACGARAIRPLAESAQVLVTLARSDASEQTVARVCLGGDHVADQASTEGNGDGGIIVTEGPRITWAHAGEPRTAMPPSYEKTPRRGDETQRARRRRTRPHLRHPFRLGANDRSATGTMASVTGQDLRTLLQLGEDDLAANRQGRLSAKQRRRQRSRAQAGGAAFAALGLLLIAGGIYSDANGGQWFVPVLLGALAIAAGLLVLLGTHGRRDGVPVRRITGPVGVVVVRVGRTGTALRLSVDGHECDLPRRRGAGLREWQAALTDQPYHVYVIGAYPTVVAIEPASR